MTQQTVQQTTAELWQQALDWHAAGRQVALATVVQTWGSSPRQAGSLMVIDGAGRFSGSVSGGCIEGEVIRNALEVLEQGGPRHLEFGVSDDQAWEVGLACGGRIRILIEQVDG